MENMREAAHSIYEEYLSEKSNPRLKIDESVIKRLIFKIRFKIKFQSRKKQLKEV
jgi:hypothetical protein